MDEHNWTVPESAVMTAAEDVFPGNNDAVLATIIDIDGSAYRRPGAKMLVPESGDGVGSITAGCLEDQLVQIASEVLNTGERRTAVFDLSGDDADVWGLGIGCNGVIEVLFDPLDESYRPAVEAYDEGRNVTVATVLDGGETTVNRGDRSYVGDDGVKTFGPWPEWLLDRIAEPALELADRGRADVVTATRGSETARIFLDGIAAPADLVVFGTGHDVAPVVDLGRKADFRVTVVGFRGATATEDRFPEADAVISTTPSDVRTALDLDESSYAVVMSHNFIDDRLVLEELLQSPVPYIGLMGPRKRFEEMLEAFADEGRDFSDDELDRLYTPVGLDLGGGTPYQIALSIISEALAVKNDRQPRHLKAREGPIHDRIVIDPGM